MTGYTLLIVPSTNRSDYASEMEYLNGLIDHIEILFSNKSKTTFNNPQGEEITLDNLPTKTEVRDLLKAFFAKNMSDSVILETFRDELMARDFMHYTDEKKFLKKLSILDKLPSSKEYIQYLFRYKQDELLKDFFNYEQDPKKVENTRGYVKEIRDEFCKRALFSFTEKQYLSEFDNILKNCPDYTNLRISSLKKVVSYFFIKESKNWKEETLNKINEFPDIKDSIRENVPYESYEQFKENTFDEEEDNVFMKKLFNN